MLRKIGLSIGFVLVPTLLLAATPLQVALLVQNTASLDRDETYLSGFLSQRGFVYDVADVEMLKNGSLDLS